MFYYIFVYTKEEKEYLKLIKFNTYTLDYYYNNNVETTIFNLEKVIESNSDTILNNTSIIEDEIENFNRISKFLESDILISEIIEFLRKFNLKTKLQDFV